MSRQPCPDCYNIGNFMGDVLDAFNPFGGPENKGSGHTDDDCIYCDGTGEFEFASCDFCHGTGKALCPTCDGRGVVYD